MKRREKDKTCGISSACVMPEKKILKNRIKNIYFPIVLEIFKSIFPYVTWDIKERPSNINFMSCTENPPEYHLFKYNFFHSHYYSMFFLIS